MTSEKRKRLGVIGVVTGSILLIVGVLIAHYTNLPLRDSVGQLIHPSIPRCAFFESDATRCWALPTVGHLTAILGSQILIVAIVFGWIFDRPLTWARATVGAFLFTLEVMILFGIVPNEWLSLTQGPLEWTRQRDAITIPKWLILNNNVTITYGVLKDMVVAGYMTTTLVIFLVGAYKYQEWGKRRGEPRPATTSVYGRPVVRGDGR